MQVGKSHPFFILERPWASISMEFITQILVEQYFNEIMVVVDHFRSMSYSFQRICIVVQNKW
jgi:hypothetical protein